MAKMKTPINAKKLERGDDYDVLPPGKYVAEVTESEIKKARSGNGEYLNLTFTVKKGEHKGRKVWAILNLWNSNTTAREIAEKEFAALCDAIGMGNAKITDSRQLHKHPLVIKVKVRPAEGKYDESNDIVGYFPLDGEKPEKGKKKKKKKGGKAPWEE